MVKGIYTWCGCVRSLASCTSVSEFALSAVWCSTVHTGRDSIVIRFSCTRVEPWPSTNLGVRPAVRRKIRAVKRNDERKRTCILGSEVCWLHIVHSQVSYQPLRLGIFEALNNECRRILVFDEAAACRNPPRLKRVRIRTLVCQPQPLMWKTWLCKSCWLCLSVRNLRLLFLSTESQCIHGPGGSCEHAENPSPASLLVVRIYEI